MAIFTRNESSNALKLSLSTFYNLHPAVLLLHYVNLFAFIFLLTSPMYTLALCVVSVCMAARYAGATVAGLKYGAISVIMLALITPLTNRRGATILAYLFDKPVTLESMLYGVQFALMFFCLLTLFAGFNSVLNERRFLYLFSKTIPKFSFMLELSLRLTGLYIKRSEDILDAQKTRNVRGLTQKIKSSAAMLITLITWSLDEGMQISLSLKSKHYATKKRTVFGTYKFTALDAFVAAFEVVAAIPVFALLFGGNAIGTYSLFPAVTLPELHAVSFVPFLLIILLPFALDVRVKPNGGYNGGYSVQIVNTQIVNAQEDCNAAD